MSGDKCKECGSGFGYHTVPCPNHPKKGNWSCPNCPGWNTWHAKECPTKGYQAPSTKASDDEPVTKRDTAVVDMCCGGTCVRALCMFHGGKAKP